MKKIKNIKNQILSKFKGWYVVAIIIILLLIAFGWFALYILFSLAILWFVIYVIVKLITKFVEW